MPITWGVGEGGGGYAPVPVDPILAGQRPYIPPVSSGEPGQIIPAPVPQVPSVQYSSVARVAQAYSQNLISYNQAYQILVEQFGLSGNDATEMLTIELEQTVAYQDLETNAPGTPGFVGFVETEPASEPISTPEISDTGDREPIHLIPIGKGKGIPLFENFELVGLVAVIAALVMFKRQG